MECCETQCCCLVCLRPDQASRLVGDLYPRGATISGAERGLAAQSVKDLVDLARSRPSKVPDIGAVLERRITRDLRGERWGYVEVSLEAVNAILAADRASHASVGVRIAGGVSDATVLEVFEPHARVLVERLLQSPVARIRAAAATTVRHRSAAAGREAAPTFPLAMAPRPLIPKPARPPVAVRPPPPRAPPEP